MDNLRIDDAGYPDTRLFLYTLVGRGEEMRVATVEKSNATRYAHVWIHEIQCVNAARLQGIGEAIAAAVAQARAWEEEDSK